MGVYGEGGAGDANGVEGHGSGASSGVAGFGDSSGENPGTGVSGQGGVVTGIIGDRGAPGVRGIGGGRGAYGNANGVEGYGSGA